MISTECSSEPFPILFCLPSFPLRLLRLRPCADCPTLTPWLVWQMLSSVDTALLAVERDLFDESPEFLQSSTGLQPPPSKPSSSSSSSGTAPLQPEDVAAVFGNLKEDDGGNEHFVLPSLPARLRSWFANQV